MSRSGASASAADPRASRSIGEVLDQLRVEFPDTTISKLRYLESEGLVEPERTPAGYRKFSAGDIERLRYVLTAQRDHYLPLRVIREQLDALDRGEQPAGPGPATPENWLSAWNQPNEQGGGNDGGCGDQEQLRLSRKELTERAGISDALLRELEQFGLVAQRSGYYDNTMLVIARTVSQLSQYGLEPRHLRTFRTAADREVSLLQQVVTPVLSQRDPEAKDRAEETLRELAEMSIRLHAALVQNALRPSSER